MTASIPAASGPGPDRSRPRGADQRPWSWHLDRAAALLLVILIPLHFAVTFLIDDLGETTARTMSERLDDPMWRMITWLTLALALIHAALSADSALRKRRPGRAGTIATAVVGVVAGALFASATWILATRWV